MSGYCKFSFDGKYRYVLGKQSLQRLYCIGVNPSTAKLDANGNIKPDPTISRVEKVANENGFQDWEMLNLYPQVATNIKGLDEHLNETEHKTNLEVFRKIPDNPTIWAAWGALIKKRDYLKQCLDDMFKY